MVHLGIDGGKSGGIALLDSDANIIKLWTMPIIQGKKKEYDIKEISEILADIKRDHPSISVILESAQVIPLNGKLSCFQSGFCFGIFQALLISLKIPFQIVRAKEWQKTVFKGLNQKDTKANSILFCQNKYPDQDFRKSARCRIKHDGLTDATCMAYYSFLLNNKMEK